MALCAHAVSMTSQQLKRDSKSAKAQASATCAGEKAATRGHEELSVEEGSGQFVKGAAQPPTGSCPDWASPSEV